MDGHPPQQSSEDASPPDERLDEGAPAAVDASSTARTASSRGRGRGRRGRPSGQRKPTSSTEAPRRSGRRSLSASSHSVEHSTAGSSGGGGSIRDSAHNPTRGQGVRDGGSIFQIRGSRARGDEEDGPPRQKRKVERTYADGSSYNGFVSDGKRDGQGTLTRPGGVREEGVFVNDELIKGTATNMKLKNGARYTGQIDGGVPNGTGTVISAEFVDHGIFVDGFLHGPGKRTFPGGEEEGNFVNGKFDNGTATNTIFRRAAGISSHEGVCTYTGQIADGVPNGTGTATFSNGADKDASYHLGYGVGTVVEKGVFVGGFLHGRGKVTCPKNGKKEGIFVNGKLDNGTTTFSHFGGRGESVGHYSGQIAGGAPNGAGTMTFDDSREKGTFVNGKLSGQGHKKFGIGWEDGVYVNGMLHGRGERCGEGGLYEKGEFVNGILHGQGWKGKDRWGVEEGEFANGRLNGQGKRKITHYKNYHPFHVTRETFHRLDKPVLEEGIFVDGILDTGTVENIEWWYGDNTNWAGIYTGQIVGGKLNGEGRKKKGSLVEEGVFVDNYLREGKATSDHDGEVHEGVFDVDGLRKGKITFDDGEMHEGVFDVGGLQHLREGKITFPREGKNGEMKIEGVFVDGRLNGRGKITYADGVVHEGDFVNGCLNGHGKVTAADLSMEGNFVGGNLNGLGTLTYDDGGIIKGTFVDGYIDAGTAENYKCDDGNIYTGEIVGGLPTGSRTTW